MESIAQQNPIKVIENAAFMYPLYGIGYFALNQELWPIYISLLIPQLIILLCTYLVVMVLFFPTIGFLSIIFLGPGGLAWTWATIFQVSVQFSTILVIVLLMPNIETTIFDAVLSRNHNDQLVKSNKLKRKQRIPVLLKLFNYVGSVPNWLTIPYFITRALIILLFGCIPVVGPFLVAYIKAPTRGLQAHSRYFVLKELNDQQIKQIYRSKKSEYTGFGLVANVLESIPFLNLLFIFTNTLGAALWVVQIENEKGLAEDIGEKVYSSGAIEYVSQLTDSQLVPVQPIPQPTPIQPDQS